jgi:hypothetical protein
MGMMTMSVMAIQMLLCNAVQVLFAATDQPAWVCELISDWITTMPMIMVTSSVMMMPTMPAPTFAVCYSSYMLGYALKHISMILL